MLTHFSLFSGTGSIDWTAEQVGFETVGQCEFADYATKVLEKHWPDVPRWRDVRSVTADSFRERTGLHTVDLISGGFPCQPFSVAGKQKGKGDDRYLWPEMLRVIRELKPRWVLGENVPGILRIAGDTVCQDLEREGYDVGIFNFEAAAVGAPHRRERVFFVGNAKHDGPSAPTFTGFRHENASRREERQESPFELKGAGQPGRNEAVADTDAEWKLQSQRFFAALRGWPRDSGQDVADADSLRRPRQGTGQSDTNEQRDNATLEQSRRSELHEAFAGCQDVSNTSGTMSHRSLKHSDAGRFSGFTDTNRRPAEPGLGGVADGFPGGLDGDISHWTEEPAHIPRIATGIKNRADRLKCLGNAVVPQQIYPILRAIYEIEKWRADHE